MKSSRPLALAAALVVAIACTQVGDPVTDILAGLSQVATTDTSMPPDLPPPSAPGSFHGYYLGYTPGVGVDTFQTSEKIANATVRAYARVAPSAADPVGVGPLAANVLTDANGLFQLPVLPGGEYIVTFTPPNGSKYRGAWTIGTASATSNQDPWWIMVLAK